MGALRLLFVFRILAVLEFLRMLLPVAVFLFPPLQTMKSRIHCLVPRKLQNGALGENIGAAYRSNQKDQDGSERLEQPVQHKGKGSAQDAAAGAFLGASRIDSGRIVSGLRGQVRSDQLRKNADDEEQPQNRQNLGCDLVIALAHQYIVQVQAEHQNRKQVRHHSGQAEHQVGEKASHNTEVHEIAQKQENHQRKKRDQRHIALYHGGLVFPAAASSAGP